MVEATQTQTSIAPCAVPAWVKPYVDARLGGIYEETFDIPDKSKWKDGRDGGIVLKPMWLPGPQGQDYGGKKPRLPEMVELCEKQPSYEAFRPRRPFRVHNARLMQDVHLAAGGTLASFFEEHGFVLISHPTQVTDWSDGRQIREVYRREVEHITRRLLLPGKRIARFDHTDSVLQRGASLPLGNGAKPGNYNPMYAGDAHQDLGRTPKAFIDNFIAHTSADIEQLGDWTQYKDQFLKALTPDAKGATKDAVDTFMQINFWRTMQMNDHPAPLTHLPLALLDGATMELEDLVPTGLVGFSPTGMASSELAIRHNPRQRWCYYPAMTSDEIIVLKQFQWHRDQGPHQPYRCPLHVAFKDHSAPQTNQRRRNCEYRFQVSIGQAAVPRPVRDSQMAARHTSAKSRL